ncbi:fatty acid synthase-like, partial [Monomorium pharaonis]|uniref:fatty acid synthase-like n=1 Tax=Monomorium pharaonis TaxID=307658 RepID=UPI001746E0D2
CPILTETLIVILTHISYLVGVLSRKGYCRPFDIDGDGYTRSEMVTVIYLQKAKNAKRIYAICPHIKLNSDGYKEEGITYPSSQMQTTLLKEFYNECGIPPSCLDCIEAHGTGTKVGDPNEISAVCAAFGASKETPLMIGSVKSNIGHSEPASGFGQIAKVIIAFEAGFFPPNVNYVSPRRDIEALLNGTVRVVEEPMPIKNGYIGLSSFGFGGSNAHVLLKWNNKQKIKNEATNDDLPKLVILSGRTEESVKLFLNDIANQPIDIEYIRLLHDVHADNIDGHPWRGFIILNNLKQEPIYEIQNCVNMKRPVCFIFSALGSQWPGMGRNLLKFHIFANTIRRCDEFLKPYSISVMDILTDTTQNVYENALYAFVGIVAIQIGLVDLLTSLGISSDYMISHSGGELGCAYADKCLTIEQTILSAYFIGVACVEGKIISSCMALVSLNYKSLKNMCLADIEIICRNSKNSSIVCGPTESVQKFVKKLQLNDIHVKEILCNVPYHSSYLASVKTQLLCNLNKVIPWPKKRSTKWISSSVSCTKWFTSASNLSSADYHTDSILNTILFEQTTHLIPSNAVTIEIAPDGVLQSVLKESLHPKVTNIVLNQRTDVDIFLQEIGKLYNCGLQPQVANLYPPVKFPVSRGTPMIAPSIRWDHSEDWFAFKYQEQKYNKFRERHVEILLQSEDYEFMSGHVIDGRNLVPATGYLALVWETFGMIKGKIYTSVPITFQDVRFIRATHLSKNEATKLMIAILKDGRFEITEGDSVIVTGRVYEPLNPEKEITSADILSENNEEEHMTTKDIYKELKLRGYQYSGLFRGLHSASVSNNKGHVAWKNNWITFMDTMLQMHIIGHDTRDLYVPTSIEKLTINPALHAWTVQQIENQDPTTNTDKHVLLPIRVYKEIDTVIAGGIELRGVKATQIARRKLVQDAVIEENVFVAHHDRAKISLSEAIRISAQLALEDHQVTKVKAIELVEDDDNVRNDLSTFCWVESDLSIKPDRKDLVDVVYSSLNFKDVMVATGRVVFNQILRGRLCQYIPLGMEYVGFDVNGQRVMGLNDTNCIANVVATRKNMFWKIPDAWTFEEAATIPCVYGTIYIALYVLGKMKKDDKILIHSGTGGIGQAAINLALKEGCEVFTTVGTSEKRDFIKKLFPAILDEHIGNSRDTSFEQMIMNQTNGRGVDIVLNSLAEEKLIASVNCLAQNGRFLEIGKFDLTSNNPLSVSAFQKGISFHGIVIDEMIFGDHKHTPLMFKMIAAGVNNGTVVPIQAKVFPRTDIEKAFRYMASGKHMGKIILNIQKKDKPSDEPVIAYRRYYCYANKSYVILGGLGGFGLELTDWLIFRGARNIVLVSRTGIKNGYQRMKIRLWESYGVNVLIIKNIDVADPKDCEYLLQTAEKRAPVDAIFNLAVVLRDNILKNQTATAFAESFQSKARATQALDKCSRKICSKLRHFVVFSSVSCGRGNPGQTNYGMANSVMERVCEKRTEEGLPALAIQWGAVGDVGLVADMQEDDKELIIGGTLQQKISCCLDELDKLLLQSRPVVSSMVVAEKKTGSFGLGSLIETVASILDIKDIKVISHNMSLAELGIDSMMGIEIKQTLEREFDIFLTAQEIRNLTFAKLIKMSNVDASDYDTQNKLKINTETVEIIKFLVGIVKDADFISETSIELSTGKKETNTEVFLIPGADGCATVFNHLAPNMKFSTTSLQYNTNNIDANIIAKTTDHFTNHILSSKLKGTKDFVVVGYSFGSFIAIELTRRLEAMNFKGRLLLIDGAPEQMQIMYNNYASDMTETDLQNSVLTNIMDIYSPGFSKKILTELEKCDTWEERYNIFSKQFLAMNKLLSPTNLKTLCTTVYTHFSIIPHYDLSTLSPIKSPITLLKCTNPLHTFMIEEDYGLKKVTQNVLKVHYVEGTHVTILKNGKVSAAINGEPPFTC